MGHNGITSCYNDSKISSANVPTTLPLLPPRCLPLARLHTSLPLAPRPRVVAHDHPTEAPYPRMGTFNPATTTTASSSTTTTTASPSHRMGTCGRTIKRSQHPPSLPVPTTYIVHCQAPNSVHLRPVAW